MPISDYLPGTLHADYLGDGVYAGLRDGDQCLTLFVYNGIDVTNVIFLENEVIAALDRYRARQIARQSEERNG